MWNVVPEIEAVTGLRLQRAQTSCLFVRIIFQEARFDSLQKRRVWIRRIGLRAGNGSRGAIVPGRVRTPYIVPSITLAKRGDAFVHFIRCHRGAPAEVIAAGYRDRERNLSERHAAVQDDLSKQLGFRFVGGWLANAAVPFGSARLGAGIIRLAFECRIRIVVASARRSGRSHCGCVDASAGDGQGSDGNRLHAQHRGELYGAP